METPGAVRAVFADAGYWIALFLPGDDWHDAALEATTSLPDARIVTTEEVLTEFLTFFAGFSTSTRRAAVEVVEGLLGDPDVEVLPQSHQSFLNGLALYQRRPDKQYSLQDCISFASMREHGLSEALTPDKHFHQEGFIVLMRR